MLDPRRGLYWPGGQTLFVADTHFGKDATARSLGVAVPHGVTASDLRRLDSMISDYRPAAVWILGDVFDSRAASEAKTSDLVAGYVERWKPVLVAMVPGNHDRHARTLADRTGIAWHPAETSVGPWGLAHEPCASTSGHVLCGHLHPGVRLRGAGRQSLRLPCFMVGDECSVLPAFSEFTGLAIQRATGTTRLFPVTSREVHPAVQNSRSSR